MRRCDNILCVVIAPDEDVRRYNERQKKKAEPPVQVDEVDSCFPRTPERVGITLEDDPEGQCSTCVLLIFHMEGSKSILLALFQKYIKASAGSKKARLFNV